MWNSVCILIILAAFLPKLFWCTTKENIPKDLVIKIDQGPVRGVLSDNGQYYSFRGIPYGTIKETNRFKRAYPPPTWIETRDPIDVTCPQPGNASSEDCLVVDVFLPSRRSPNEYLPVLAAIHGGFFTYGYADTAVEYLIPQGVIIVTMTYRLGLFGFLCLGTDMAPGNAGMKDQVDALRWIRDNIAYFGGNPGAVTISGVSSGAACVDFLILSPMAKGLFQSAIAESGVSVAYWTFNRELKMTTDRAATALGATRSGINEIERVFKKASTSDIVDATTVIANSVLNTTTPCIEINHRVEEAFLSKLPQDIIKSNEQNLVPKLIGFNNKEGIIAMLGSYPTFSDYLPSDLNMNSYIDQESIYSRIKKFYYNKVNITESSDYNFIDYVTDALFLWPLFWRIELEHFTVPETYLYEFLYDGNLNYVKIINNLTKYEGACHADEYGYIYNRLNISTPIAKDLHIVEIMTTLWANFIKFKNPTPEVTELLPIPWKPFTMKEKEFLRINSILTIGSLNQPPLSHRINFWKSIYVQYGTVLPDNIMS